MARKRRTRRRRRAKSSGLGFLDELGKSAFSRAFHSHIEELSYENLKDPEYQEWMQNWLEGFLSAFLKGLRAKRGGRRRTRAGAIR